MCCYDGLLRVFQVFFFRFIEKLHFAHFIAGAVIICVSE